MTKLLISNLGIITISSIHFKCPNCSCVHKESSYYDRLCNSKKGVVYDDCVKCGDRFGISVNMKGNIIAWSKNNEK